jgi:hypothetical protein
MKRLTKYSDFNALKLESNTRSERRSQDKSLLSEFESFLNQLKQELSIKKKNKTSANGKNSI